MRGRGARESKCKWHSDEQGQGSEDQISVPPTVAGDQMLHQWRNKERSNTRSRDNNRQRRAQTLFKPPRHDARIAELICARPRNANKDSGDVELRQMRREPGQRRYSRAEARHEQGDDLSWLEAVK